MADWKDLLAHVRSSYNIAEEGDGVLRLDFTLARGRAQMVVVTHHKLMGRRPGAPSGDKEEWAQV